MRKNIYIFLFFVLFSKTTMSCPSSGDGDCLPQVIDKNQSSNIQAERRVELSAPHVPRTNGAVDQAAAVALANARGTRSKTVARIRGG